MIFKIESFFYLVMTQFILPPICLQRCVLAKRLLWLILLSQLLGKTSNFSNNYVFNNYFMFSLVIITIIVMNDHHLQLQFI